MTLRSDRAHPGVALAASRQQQSIVDQMVDPDLHGLIIDLGLVQARAAAPDQPPRLALVATKPLRWNSSTTLTPCAEFVRGRLDRG